jgi:hypothetical protein
VGEPALEARAFPESLRAVSAADFLVAAGSPAFLVSSAGPAGYFELDRERDETKARGPRRSTPIGKLEELSQAILLTTPRCCKAYN